MTDQPPISVTDDALGNSIIRHFEGNVTVTRGSDGEVLEIPSLPMDVQEKQANRFLGIWPALRLMQADVTYAIDRVRDRRIDGGFTYDGHAYQSRPSDRENIMGAAQAAFMAVAAGAPDGYLGWASGGASDFVWITADNETVPMDAKAVIALFQHGVAFKAAQTFYARALKDAALAISDPAALDAFLSNVETGWPD